MRIVKSVHPTAIYCRLSREDGDRPESDSIGNQKKMLEAYIESHADLEAYHVYTDDGYTGTNFNRPAFSQMIKDIEAGYITCVLVKDLSRFGRDYIETGRYLERWLPEHNTRFIAINDGIDSTQGTYDMMMPIKNIFNAQYAKDISTKVKSAFKAKQTRGEFVGAFASYGYLKDPNQRNHLIIDPVAAPTVQRIFTLFEQGYGKIRIAKTLNEEGIPCPSQYKRLMGEKYHNAHRLEQTTYWTYATINRILHCEMYIGNMEQGRNERTTLHGAAKQKDKSEWIVVEGTHDPIIPKEQWDRVQALVRSNAKTSDFTVNISPFAGYLKCGDCGRAMAKTMWGGRARYVCGSYRRYGKTACTTHYITNDVLEAVLLQDLNQIIASIHNLQQLAEEAQPQQKSVVQGERKRLESALNRIQRMKQGIYEDYKDGILNKADYLRYRADYDGQEAMLQGQLDKADSVTEQTDLLRQPWVEQLVQLGKVTQLDRATIAEILKEIRIFEDQTIEITYRFSDELRLLLED